MTSAAASEPVELPARLDLLAAEALRGDLLDRREGLDELTVCGREVSLIDTPAIQVLLSAAHDQNARGGRLVLREPSPAIVEAMAVLGLGEVLESWRESNE
ncbi:STAS domain-containing protein [Maricaulis sp.]|uniref:STAS domain-containing protein n=1 Tax=Maricaulis sp. TaxID=1486257 RepID=UPI002622DD77|nr:STAS domain-containing protein [Maricaulis sp.]